MNVTEIAPAPDGSLYIIGSDLLRRVDPTGIIRTVAGQPNKNGYAGNDGPAAAATIAVQQGGVRVAPDGTVYIAENLNKSVRRIVPPLPGFTGTSSTYQFASQGWFAGLYVRAAPARPRDLPRRDHPRAAC